MILKVGFIGAGNIAHTLAETFLQYKDKFELYAVSSKSEDKLNEFVSKYGFKKAYKSYEDLVKDKEIDLVYISTLIKDHYNHIKLCLENNKNVLCEKAFTFNYKEAKELVDLARKKNLFLGEAIWTRYMPSRGIILNLLSNDVIGKVYYIEANLGYEIKDKERIKNPKLGGGAMLDVGVYPLNFIDMFALSKLKSLKVISKLNEEGADETDIVNMEYENGVLAQFFTTINQATSREGFIYGEKGFIKVININNPEKIEIYLREDKSTNYASFVSSFNIKEEFNGYEYQLLETYSTINSSKKENPSMILDETLKIMSIVDEILHKAHYINY